MYVSSPYLSVSGEFRVGRVGRSPYPVGKFFRYEGAANSQKLANFGNRTTSEIRCRFDQRIRKFFVRRITSEFVLSSLCEIFPNFAMRIRSEFTKGFLAYTLRQTNHCRRRSEFDFNSQREFATRTSEFVSTSERNENRLKVFGPPSVHRRREFADWIGANSLSVRLRN